MEVGVGLVTAAVLDLCLKACGLLTGDKALSASLGKDNRYALVLISLESFFTASTSTIGDARILFSCGEVRASEAIEKVEIAELEGLKSWLVTPSKIPIPAGCTKGEKLSDSDDFKGGRLGKSWWCPGFSVSCSNSSSFSNFFLSSKFNKSVLLKCLYCLDISNEEATSNAFQLFLLAVFSNFTMTSSNSSLVLHLDEMKLYKDSMQLKCPYWKQRCRQLLPSPSVNK